MGSWDVVIRELLPGYLAKGRILELSKASVPDSVGHTTVVRSHEWLKLARLGESLWQATESEGFAQKS